jgi:hypothetical protein
MIMLDHAAWLYSLIWTADCALHRYTATRIHVKSIYRDNKNAYTSDLMYTTDM